MAKSTSGSTLLIVILLVLTFPIWIGIAGGLFGLAMGLFGAAIGIIAALFGVLGGLLGAIFGAIGKVFGWIFGGLFSWHYFPGIHLPGPFTIFLIVVVIALIIQSRKSPIKK
jgi:hypothetical protein